MGQEPFERAVMPGEPVSPDPIIPLASDAFSALVFQEAHVFKAGNSLAVRIPSGIAKRIGLEDGGDVEMSVSHGMLHLRKSASHELARLIAQITPENLHGPIFDDLGGSEAW